MMLAWPCVAWTLFLAGGLPYDGITVQAQGLAVSNSGPGNSAYLDLLKTIQAGNKTVFGSQGVLGGGQTYPPFQYAQGQEFNKRLRECEYLSCLNILVQRLDWLVMLSLTPILENCYIKISLQYFI